MRKCSAKRLATEFVLLCFLRSFLPRVVRMLPYSGHQSPVEFNFKGSNVLATSSVGEVHDFHAAHSTSDNQTEASLSVSLHSTGFHRAISVYYFVIKTKTEMHLK